MSVELFRQAFGPALVARPAADLFAGIQEGRFHNLRERCLGGGENGF
jgi:hypothetical protein